VLLAIICEVAPQTFIAVHPRTLLLASAGKTTCCGKQADQQSSLASRDNLDDIHKAATFVTALFR